MPKPGGSEKAAVAQSIYGGLYLDLKKRLL
jgi:hypothetical protein